MANKKPGRKKITCLLGTKKNHSLCLYDCEWVKLKNEYEKLKQLRPQYYVRSEEEKYND